MENFTKDEIYSAYRKLKHYYYYDNTSLFLRQQIVSFEDEIDNAKGNRSFKEAFDEWSTKLASELNDKTGKQWQVFFRQKIGFKITPKSLKRSSFSYLTNRSESGPLYVERINTFIDAPIEVHIIAVLWLMNAGRFLVKHIDEDNYAYRLELNDEDEEQKIVNGLRLYKPYFIQYQEWRDNAIKKAEQLINEKKDAVILGLDIKEYFHTVRIDLKDVKAKLFGLKPELKESKKVNTLFTLLDNINRTYTKKIRSDAPPKTTCLPIGLISSGLLGNLYLSPFDKKIKEDLNPAYYGRYVDDLIFVLTNVTIESDSIAPVNDFITKYFVKRNLLGLYNLETLPKAFKSKNKNKEFEYQNPKSLPEDPSDLQKLTLEAEKLKFFIEGFPSLVIQSSKVSLQEFNHKESPAILMKFKKNLDKNRSEFRFLPDEDEVDKEFEEEAFNMHYSDSVNKLRSIKEFNEDKYGASKYLAGKIFATSISEGSTDAKSSKQILTFFKGTVGIAFHTLWEKVATYFIINDQSEELIRFYRQCKNGISRMVLKTQEKQLAEDAETYRQTLAKDLSDYLLTAIATPLAFNPSFIISSLKTNEKSDFRSILEQSIKIRRANFFRHAWVGLPGLNFTDYVLYGEEEGKYLNLLKIKDQFPNSCELNLEERLYYLSPRYVHFHELNVLEIYKTVHNVSDLSEKNIQIFDTIPDQAFEKYWLINYSWKPNINGSKEALKAEYFSIKSVNVEDGKPVVNYNDKVLFVNMPYKGKIDENKKIAIANIKVEPNNIEASYLKKPNLSKERRQLLFKLLNLVEESRSDMFVLPEVSVPYQWLGLLAYQANRRSLAIIAGLEHWINKSGFAFNFMATILPIKRDKYSTCLIKIRLKNHYSPEEKRQLKGYRLLIPGETVKHAKKRYDLFHWKKTYFSVYNCFELADIQDRGLFKSRVDFIIASEYNKDTSYFSEIAGSWVRDIHCFFIQVNSSNYGDSRVLQPSSSATRNILQVKGGINSTILVGQLPIRQLRLFQLKEYELQKDDATFKPTPPDFSPASVEERILNKNLNEL
jgi:hypothetical protein